MKNTEEIINSLRREYHLYSNAVAFYEKTLQEFEKKHNMTTETFLKQFDSGQVGDDADFFDWYAFANLLSRWKKSQSEIHSAIP